MSWEVLGFEFQRYTRTSSKVQEYFFGNKPLLGHNRKQSCRLKTEVRLKMPVQHQTIPYCEDKTREDVTDKFTLIISKDFLTVMNILRYPI